MKRVFVADSDAAFVVEENNGWGLRPVNVREGDFWVVAASALICGRLLDVIDDENIYRPCLCFEL
jgi:hypothetical protein